MPAGNRTAPKKPSKPRPDLPFVAWDKCRESSGRSAVVRPPFFCERFPAAQPPAEKQSGETATGLRREPGSGVPGRRPGRE
jgi:hypothetical protein